MYEFVEWVRPLISVMLVHRVLRAWLLRTV